MVFKVNHVVQDQSHGSRSTTGSSSRKPTLYSHFFMTSTLRLAAILDGPKTIPSTHGILTYVCTAFFYSSWLCSLGLQLCSSGVFMGSGLILCDLAACRRWFWRKWNCPLCLLLFHCTRTFLIFMTGHKERYSLSRMLKDFDVWKFPNIHEHFLV
jgi:hypothetical protein